MVTRQHNHHRPQVFKRPGVWLAYCPTCGWWRNTRVWRVALIMALCHAAEVSS